ncbi:uncharacterized protein [Thunnus thynnus]|uniref:uncharacterized protein isoform X1 n=2 Tax=Thunnus thynnus TaxID=8237 RepID=UPI0035272D70
MAATAAVGRPPPVHPGPDGGNGTNQNPGPSSHPQHHVSAQPVFYVHAPHPPPFLHYQWPMPFSYNPFAGFPGMGYGMVMPPFPPPPYMEAPAYILPHPHIPPVDYRLLLHPQVHASNAPYQNPNQTRRIRQPHSFPVRETVNSEVQTEPPQRGGDGYGGGSPLISSDSGHGAASSSLSSSRSSLQKQGSPSSSPSSSHSCLQKQGSPEVKNYSLPSRQKKKDFQVDRTCTSSSVKHCFNILHPTGMKTVQPCIRATVETQNRCKDSVGQENLVSYRNAHCNMWSVSSTGSMTPVCNSSQREEEVVKERRVSVPDILMSWGGGTPQAAILKMADKVLSQNEDQLLSSEVEHEKCVYQSPTETNNGPLVADADGILSSTDSELVFKILKLPFALDELLSESKIENDPVGLVGSVQHSLPYNDELLHSLNKSQKLPDCELENNSETNPHEDTTEIIPYQMSLSSGQMKRNMNESVWSVESLAPFVPTKDWLTQNGMFESEAIVEMTEEAKNGQLSPQNDNLIIKASTERRRSRRFSSIFSTPAEKLSLPKMPEMESEIDDSDDLMRGLSKQGQSVAPSEKDPLAFSTCLSKNHLSTPTEEDVGENRSSEPEANQSPNQESYIVTEQQVKSPYKSPNQESHIVTEQQVKSPCSPEQEETLVSNSAAGRKILSTCHSDNTVDMRVEDGVYGNEEDGQVRNEQLCIPVAHQKIVEVSPSKGHLVDCGIQCSELQELKCSCEELKTNMGPNGKHLFKYSDMKKDSNGKAEGFFINGHMQKNHRRHGQWRNKRQEKHGSQQEAYNGYCGKPGKSKGGNGRNPQY